MDPLLSTLAPAERKAVALLKSSLDCFNSYDGMGFFTGPARYQVLQGRVELVATQATSLFQFWSFLLHKMRWPTPPKALDEVILALLVDEADAAVLHVLATQTASIVMLARYCHDQDKQARKAAAQAWEADPPLLTEREAGE